jgi:hypothetical protein
VEGTPARSSRQALRERSITTGLSRARRVEMGAGALPPLLVVVVVVVVVVLSAIHPARSRAARALEAVPAVSAPALAEIRDAPCRTVPVQRPVRHGSIDASYAI